ncbi:DNA-binding GntR family transcriptional regulator [Paenibacillus shirakamiensis]|uniref:DNA-binding GntR family transcriptional regulator n=1 Tax=Paenibacillus shirakamiensis TaxID=1265935 RepID=A0ABS4JKI3_9BACL|nr:GntR family transcriptional regulator [Paenibacillus shirakamiensis]MBP2002221.1 DNA-binding GntR family transcriptional regulator [Paenibacillus shirakamiensis]
METRPEPMPKGKKPLYIAVYDTLYKQIMQGVFPSDSQLPTESELAKLFDVSRMTLRQALALLQDDGLVKSIHGKGNFITKAHPNKSATLGLEKIGNPMYKCHTEPIDDVELHFRLDLESEYTQEVLQRKAAAVVAIERLYKSKGDVVGYSFTFMAIETVSEMKLDLQNEPQLLEMLESKVYELANSAILDIKRSTFVKAANQSFTMVGSGECDVLLESVYIREDYPAVYNKYYIPREFSQLKVHASK